MTLGILDREETLDWPAQREIQEDLASAILEQEDHRVREETKVIQDPEVAEETVGPRACQEAKELLETLRMRDPEESLVREVREERADEMETPALRETPASPSAMS